MQWQSYACAEYDGRCFGMKAESFAAIRDLPSRTTEKLELALGGEEAPRDDLNRAGWGLRNPLEVARGPWEYRRYIRASKAEISIAKHGYVASCSGWFSERTATYLASGRPAVVQDTGFSRLLDADLGLMSYHDIDGAVAGIEAIRSHYGAHCRAAREIALSYFGGHQVIQKIVDRLSASD